MRKTPQKTLESYRNDKAVRDNIVESWLCVDCGVNTNPGCPDGPTTRIELRLYGKSKVKHTRETEVYDVKDAIWEQAGMRAWQGCLCIGCLEKRIGRQLRPKDFSRHDRKVWATMPCPERLSNRRGFTPRRTEVELEVGLDQVQPDWSHCHRHLDIAEMQ
jgi:hypothetical protein